MWLVIVYSELRKVWFIVGGTRFLASWLVSFSAQLLSLRCLCLIDWYGPPRLSVLSVCGERGTLRFVRVVTKLRSPGVSSLCARFCSHGLINVATRVRSHGLRAVRVGLLASWELVVGSLFCTHWIVGVSIRLVAPRLRFLTLSFELQSSGSLCVAAFCRTFRLCCLRPRLCPHRSEPVAAKLRTAWCKHVRA